MEKKSVRTRDGVRLSYLEGGEGRPLVMLPGWSQTAAMFDRQFADFSKVGRVIALDHRGHGDLDKPERGYKVQRLAKDLFEVIAALQLDEPDIVAHSMGAAVAWSYLMLFGSEQQAKDQLVCFVCRAARSSWRGPT